LIVVYLGLGSNQGDREENLGKALTSLSQGVNLEQISSIYETEPVGYTEQPLFLNLVCRVTTDFPPGELLHLVKDIEMGMGRIPSFPDAPRLIDIDILFYGNEIIDFPDLTIPHPRLAERAFVLIPLSEIVLDMVHPKLGMSIAKLANNVAGRDGVRKWKSHEASIFRGKF